MRQEINLLRVEKKEPVPKLSFTLACTLQVVFFVSLYVVYWLGTDQLDTIKQDIVAMEKNTVFQQKKVVDTGDINKQQTTLKTLEKQLLNKYELWVDYQKITDAGKDGFSQHFYHIANLAGSDLSLYEIDIYDRGSSLALKGYSKKADLIPTYINYLKNQKEFELVYFGDLSIEKVEGHDVMRFSLDKKKEPKKEIETKPETIDVSDLLKLPMFSKTTTSAKNRQPLALLDGTP